MRKIILLAVALLAFSQLSGCDKCTYELQDIRLPQLPAACTR